MNKFKKGIIAGLAIAVGIMAYWSPKETSTYAMFGSTSSTTSTVNTTSAIQPVDTSSNVVVYLVPHADDEALTFSIPIVNDLRAGKKVYLVLMSDSGGTSARNVINGVYDEESGSDTYPPGTKKFCKWHGYYHDPVKEGYLDGHLTKAETGQARIREFYRAASALGVPNTQVKTHLISGFSYSSVKAIIRTQIRLFPNAEFKSMSRLDGHNEHAMVGQVLDDMYANKEIKKRQSNFISIYTDRFSPAKVPGYELKVTNSTDLTKVKNALNVYKAWDPQKGIYGIGYHSVPEQIDSMLNNTYTKVGRY